MSNSKKMTVASLEAIVTEQSAVIVNLMTDITALHNRVTALEATPTRGVRNYGPKSENGMTELIAWQIMFGDMTAMKVKDIATHFGLSRGQVYSVKGGYTFTSVKQTDFQYDEDEEGNTTIIAS